MSGIDPNRADSGATEAWALSSVATWIPAVAGMTEVSMLKSFSTLHSAAILIILTGAVVGVHDGVTHLRAAQARVEAGDDFFTYANRDWLDAARIPAGKGKWGARDEIAAATAEQVREVIRGASASPAGAKVAAYHAAYLDEKTIEDRGLAPLKAPLAEIDRIASTTDLSRYLGAHLRADVDPLGLGITSSAHLFGFAASYGNRGETEYVAYLTQGGLGLGDRDRYLDETAGPPATKRLYRNYIALMLGAAGQGDTTRRAQAVLELETAIARTHASAADSAKDNNADNHWARGDFGLEAPGIDWRAFFAAAGLAKRGDFVVWQPDAIRGGSALVASQPLAAWKDYLRFHLLDRHADVLPHRFADRAQAFHENATPRRQRAIDATNRALPEAVGRLYTARYFPPASKARAQAILDHVLASFRKRVAAATWMTPESKRVALAKLETMYFGVGYPERWADDSGLAIDPRDALGNALRIDEWRYRQALAKLDREVDRREWAIAPQFPGAILNFQLNSYNFAAALLQPPKFDANGSEAANYGAIGAIFAHELTHFVDALGADYDADGAAHPWWTAADKAHYDTRTAPLAAQFVAYEPLPNAPIDGKRTLVENVADLSGLETAYDAYREAMIEWRDARQDREFFLGFARSWRATMNDEALAKVVQTDNHAPEAYRIATVRNVDAWYDAFDVKPGQRLYLPPERRAHVW